MKKRLSRSIVLRRALMLGNRSSKSDSEFFREQCLRWDNPLHRRRQHPSTSDRWMLEKLTRDMSLKKIVIAPGVCR